MVSEIFDQGVRFPFAYVFGEEKLPVQIRALDKIMFNDGEVTDALAHETVSDFTIYPAATNEHNTSTLNGFLIVPIQKLLSVGDG
jgi:hypothetical protein